jgi:fumarate hydratase class II
VAFAGSQGNFELNVMRPLVVDNVLDSARLLADACDKLRRFSIEGAELDRGRIDDYLHRSLMLVTALSPVIGYDKASEIAHRAHVEGITLREAALATGYVTPEEFDRVVVPSRMVGDPHGDLGL